MKQAGPTEVILMIAVDDYMEGEWRTWEFVFLKSVKPLS